MQHSFLVAILYTLMSAVMTIQRVGPPAAYPPVRGESSFVLDMRVAALPQSFPALVDKANVIVDAQVHSTFQPRVLGQASLETDVVLLVNKVLKRRAGSRETDQFVVAQMGGIIGEYKELPTQYALMQPGERYILFLSDDDRPNLPDRGIPRQIIVGGWIGMFRIEDEKVHPGQSAFQHKYEGIAVAQLLSEILSYIKPDLQQR